MDATVAELPSPVRSCRRNVRSICCGHGHRHQRPAGLGSPALARRASARRSARAPEPRPGVPAQMAPLPEDIDPRIASALIAQGIAELYTHQAETYALARSGKHVCVVTGTASGKSLAYTLPLVQELLERKRRALALPEPDEGARAGPGAAPDRAAARPAADAVRRRHAARAPAARAQVGQPDPHEPRHAAPRDPPEPRALGRGAREPHARGGRRGARLPRRLRQPRRAGAAAAPPHLRDLRRRARRSCSRRRPSRTRASSRAP